MINSEITKQMTIIRNILKDQQWKEEDITTALVVITNLVTKAAIIEVIQEATPEQRARIAQTPVTELTLDKAQEILGIDSSALQEKFIKALTEYTQQLPDNVMTLTKVMLEKPDTHN